MSLDSILLNREIFGSDYRGNRIFHRSIKSNESLVKRFGKIHTLKGHSGCVNTILFSESGDHLISGSDDKKIIIYDVNTGSLLVKYKTIHKNNIFFAKDLPYSDHKIISCGGDGRVVLMDIETTSNLNLNNNYSNSFHSTVLHKHKGVAHRICMVPQSSDQFYSCGSDGVCAFFDLRSKINNNVENDDINNNTIMQTIFKNSNDKKASIYSIQVNPLKLNEFALSGSFQCSAIYDTRKFDLPISYQCPSHLINSSEVSITGMKYTSDGEHLISSYNDEDIYRININLQSIYNLKEMMKKQDRYPDSFISTSKENDKMDENENLKKDNNYDDNLGFVNKYMGHRNNDTIKQVSTMGSESEFVVSGSDCGNIFIWNTITSKLIKLLKGDNIGAINCLNQHPTRPLLASSGLENTSKIWGIIDDQSDEEHDDDEDRNDKRIHTYNEKGIRARSKLIEKDRQEAVMRSNLRDRNNFQHDISIFAIMNMISRDEITLEDLSIEQFNALCEMINSQDVYDESSNSDSSISDNDIHIDNDESSDLDSSSDDNSNDDTSNSSKDSYVGIQYSSDSDTWSTCSNNDNSNENSDNIDMKILSTSNNKNIQDNENIEDNEDNENIEDKITDSIDINEETINNGKKENNKKIKLS